jgi:four helix bundle protein
MSVNAEHRTSNIERRSMKTDRYDLEERLLEYAARIIRLSENVTRSRAGTHVAQQFLRSGTSPLPNHGEAQAAESSDDFIHKLKVCLKELRETYRWLPLVQRVLLIKKPERVDPLLQEADELIRIFVTSLKTAQRNSHV